MPAVAASLRDGSTLLHLSLPSRPVNGYFAGHVQTMAMQTRPASIRDIARASGFSKSTVAAALNNSPELRAETKATVRAAAEQLGYRRDPLVADLAARRWRSRPKANQPTLAYIYDHGTVYEQDGRVNTSEPSPEMEQTASLYGYRLEKINLREFDSDARASQVLYNRGYRGLIVGRILRRDRPLELDWPRFTAIACDVGYFRPPLHTVILDRFAAAQVATRTAIERGYRRPGYVHLRHSDWEPIEPCRLGGYLEARSALPQRHHLPVHVGLFADTRGKAMAGWLRSAKPDVVIGFSNLVAWWMKQAGVRVPEDIAFAVIDRPIACTPDTTGIIGSNAAVYRTAVEMIIGQIHLNARGMPNPVQTVLVDPPWHEGTTLPPARQG